MWHLVANPASGRGRGRHVLRRVVRALSHAGVPFDVWPTERPGHARALVEALPCDARVVALGGDGTLNEVARACLGSRRLMAVIPAGTGDDFAHALGLPRGDLAAAVHVLRAGRERLVDVGRVDGNLFVNAAGFGVDAEVGARAARAPRPLRGAAAYAWAVASVLPRLSSADVQVELDGQLRFQGRALLVTTQNGPRAGGSFTFAPRARIDDGWLDVLVAGPLGPLGAARLLPSLVRGRLPAHPQLHPFRARRVRIAWASPHALHTDGEGHEARANAELEVDPRALRVLAPAP